MLKSLRIAVTALCLTASVLLVALWARSYIYIVDIQTVPFANRTYQFYVSPGRMYFRTQRVDSEWLSGFWQIRKSDSDFDNWNNPNSSAFYLSINQYGPGDLALRFPYWFPVVITMALAAAPWLPWRFSLRTLLIATTLVAMGLGVFAVLN
jgi:hypothetical protein